MVGEDRGGRHAIAAAAYCERQGGHFDEIHAEEMQTDNFCVGCGVLDNMVVVVAIDNEADAPLGSWVANC